MTQLKDEPPLRVGLISLGCAKNLVDAEIMLGTLLKGGMQITNDARHADVLIVNTCSFIDAAQEESVDTILQSAEVRQASNRGQGLIVAGCLPQRFREELPKLLPEVDAFMGIDQVAEVTHIVRQVRARRLEAAGKNKPRVPARKDKVLHKLAEVDQARSRAAAGQGTGVESKARVEVSKSTPSEPNGRLETKHAKDSRIGSAGPLLEVNERPKYIPDYATPRFRLTPRHFAYLKIAEGCNHPCSFCIIPRMRGSHRSRVQSDILAEASALLADGVKELNLISQDSTYYGLDLRPNHTRAIASPERFNAAVKALPAEATTLSTLLGGLSHLPGEFWIRILYTHPAHWTDQLIQTIAASPKVARYVDIPLQHIHQNMLERMRRETSQQYIVDLLGRIRAAIPGIALRTTFIVGFPGETEEYFETLLDFIRRARFERLGVFTYSKEQGTRAGNMAGQIPDKIKRHRRDRAMAVQHEIAVSVSESFVGRTIRVLVEKAAEAKELKQARVGSWEHGMIRGRDNHHGCLKGTFMLARGEADAPDIDGRVYVHGELPVGEFAFVKVVAHTDYDLIAEPV